MSGPRVDAGAVCRLFCLPYAGGSASAFGRWRDLLPSWIDVRPLELPGRGPHTDLPPLTELPRVMAHLGSAVAPLLDRPYVVYGHSLGALLAFELARWCRAHRLPQPAALCVGARIAPHLPTHNHFHLLPDTELIEAVRTINDAVPAALLTDERVRPFLPTLRADFGLSSTYSYRPGDQLDCSIVAFAGRGDGNVDPAGVRAWAAHTRRNFRWHELDGGHLFLFTARDELVARIRREVEVHCLPPQGTAVLPGQLQVLGG